MTANTDKASETPFDISGLSANARVLTIKGDVLLASLLDQAAIEIVNLRQQIERLTKELKIAQIKNQGSLANNLCPDHRDKQTGKPCLTCEIERLTKERDAAHDEAIETAAQDMHDLSQVWGQDSPTAKDKYETYLHAAQRIRSLKRG